MDGGKIGSEFGLKDRDVRTAGIYGYVISVGDQGNTLGRAR